MVTENRPSVTGALAMAALNPSGLASNMTTVPEAFGARVPETECVPGPGLQRPK
jgi:hypothetical protein